MSVVSALKRSAGDLVGRLVERLARRQLEELRGSLAVNEARLDEAIREASAEGEREREKAARQSLQVRLLQSRQLWASMPLVGESAPPADSDFDRDLARLAQLHPHLFPRWRQVNMVDNPAEYLARPSSSCSVGLGKNDLAFAGFIAPYLQGRVLDLGCGPQAIPSYLTGYPTHLISGLDPLEPFEPHPFQFARGFGEFIPWPDQTFDVVVNATSLDHSLSLDAVTGEIIRVLKPGGLLLVWEGIVKGSPRYQPSDPSIEPVDQYHFFHFDRPWFEAHFGVAFDIVEHLSLDESKCNPPPSTNDFYALRFRGRP